LIGTNPGERQAVYDLFKNNPHCLVQHDYMHYQKSMHFQDDDNQRRRLEFYRTLKRCKYAICPQGTGIDTHRVYECVNLGVIPIVRSSPLDSLYASMAVKVVRDWTDVIQLLEQEARSGTLQPAQ
jgi:hypothetical protein